MQRLLLFGGGLARRRRRDRGHGVLERISIDALLADRGESERLQLGDYRARYTAARQLRRRHTVRHALENVESLALLWGDVREKLVQGGGSGRDHAHGLEPIDARRQPKRRQRGRQRGAGARKVIVGDRKSTRLNSSHSQISYAVFCLKKKKKKKRV